MRLYGRRQEREVVAFDEVPQRRLDVIRWRSDRFRVPVKGKALG
jgi:hypothetical protein